MSVFPGGHLLLPFISVCGKDGDCRGPMSVRTHGLDARKPAVRRSVPTPSVSVSAQRCSLARQDAAAPDPAVRLLLSADHPLECRWHRSRGKTRIAIFTIPLEKDKRGFYEAQVECCVPVVPKSCKRGSVCDFMTIVLTILTPPPHFICYSKRNYNPRVIFR